MLVAAVRAPGPPVHRGEEPVPGGWGDPVLKDTVLDRLGEDRRGDGAEGDETELVEGNGGQVHPRRPADLVLAVNVVDVAVGVLGDAGMGGGEQFAALAVLH